MLEPLGVIFVGSHPMAGREFSGFDYSTDDLFKGASYIITPSENTPKMAIDLLSTLAGCMGFGKVVTATPKPVSYTHLDVYKRQGIKYRTAHREYLVFGKFKALCSDTAISLVGKH